MDERPTLGQAALLGFGGYAAASLPLVLWAMNLRYDRWEQVELLPYVSAVLGFGGLGLVLALVAFFFVEELTVRRLGKRLIWGFALLLGLLVAYMVVPV